VKELQKYLLLLLALFLVGLLFFDYQRHLQISMIRKEAIVRSHKRFSSSLSSFDKLSQNFYNDYSDYIARALYHIGNKQKDTSRFWREKLLIRLYPPYRSAILFGLNQFQIIDRRGYSFLRFHYYHRQTSGETPIKHRNSIRELLAKRHCLTGFEAGKYVDGFRYIYPLFYNGVFVGGYEWVWSHEALIRELRRIYGGRYAIVVRRSVMKPVMLHQEILRQYTPLPVCSDFMFQKNALGIYGRSRTTFMKDLARVPSLCRRMREAQDHAFAIKVAEQDYLVTVLDLKDISGQSYGAFISISREGRITSANHLFLMEVFSLLAILFLIYLLLYRSYRDKMFVRTLLDAQKDIVFLTDDERIRDANRAFLEFFDVGSVEQFIRQYGCICNLFIEAEGYVGSRPDGMNWLAYMRRNQGENKAIIFDHLRGEERIFMVSVSHYDDSGLYVVSLRDITEMEREKRRFKIESMVDHLTRLFNRRTFEEYLEDRLESMRKGVDNPVALIMFDIDHFKQINDRYGHRKGDEVLRHLAHLLTSMITENDFLVRWGGEEFVIIMEKADLKEACRKTETLRSKIASSRFGIDESLTCSFGVTMLHRDDTPATATERADSLLYQAKENGRNRISCDDQK